jgi:hypothetical protein
VSSIDDDERTYVSLSSDEGNNKCAIDFLILIFYGGMCTIEIFVCYKNSFSLGNIFSTEDAFYIAKKTDFLTFRTTFETVLRNHYPRFEGKIAIRFVECRSICIETINLLNSLSSYGMANLPQDISHSETLPINAIPLFAISNPNYQTILNNAIASTNNVYQEFLASKEGKHFSGQVMNTERSKLSCNLLFLKVVVIGDANGAILAYDALCLNHQFDDATSLYGDGKGIDTNRLNIHLFLNRGFNTTYTSSIETNDDYSSTGYE